MSRAIHRFLCCLGIHHIRRYDGIGGDRWSCLYCGAKERSA